MNEKKLLKRLNKIAAFKVVHELNHYQTGRCTICSFNSGAVDVAKSLLKDFFPKKHRG